MFGTGSNRLLKRLLKKPVVELCSHPPMRRVICWRFSRNQRQVALTFDDGPHPIYTPQTLDVLAEHSLRATFFVLGSQIEEHPEIFRRMIDEGHDVGIHGYVHSPDDMAEQTLRTLDVVARFGVSPSIFRPPYGIMSPRTGMWMLRHGFSVVFWSVDGRDSMRHEGKASTHDTYEDIGPGDIVLLHDDNPVCVADVPAIAAVLRKKRLEAVRVSDMLAS